MAAAMTQDHTTCGAGYDLFQHVIDIAAAVHAPDIVMPAFVGTGSIEKYTIRKHPARRMAAVLAIQTHAVAWNIDPMRLVLDYVGNAATERRCRLDDIDRERALSRADQMDRVGDTGKATTDDDHSNGTVIGHSVFIHFRASATS